MYKIFISLFFITTLLSAEDATSFVKEKKEIKELKQDLNVFYNKKEEEYKKRKAELDALLAKIQKEKNEIQSLHDQNAAILKDIEGTVATKTSKIYNAMKPKVAADIFNQMIIDGKIEEVFDIIIKLKEKKVTQIMKFLDLESAALITQMLQGYKTQTKDSNG